MSPRFSLVSPAYNEEVLLPRLLDSLDVARRTYGQPDLIEVIGFAGEPERQVRMQSARNRLGVSQSIARLIAQGGTQLFPALDLAYQDLVVARARLKHVILLTDGQTQESGISDVIQAMRGENITVSTVGLGHDVNRELLQTAASLGGGRAYFTFLDTYPYHAGGEGYGDYFRFTQDAVALLLQRFTDVDVLRGGGACQAVLNYLPVRVARAVQPIANVLDDLRPFHLTPMRYAFATK